MCGKARHCACADLVGVKSLGCGCYPAIGIRCIGTALARLGPRFLIRRIRMRSRSSMGAYIPLGRKRSARRSLSYILIFPEKRMAGVSGDISFTLLMRLA